MSQQQKQEENTQQSGRGYSSASAHSPWWRHQDEKKILSAPTPQPAPQVRVRADELARALREMEARGAEQVALAEALRELAPTITAEQVLAEIRAQRATEAVRTAAREGALTAQANRRLRRARLVVAATSLIVTVGAVRSVVRQSAHYYPSQTIPSHTPAPPVTTPVYLLGGQLVVTGGQLTHLTPTMKPLLSFPENQPFRIDTRTLSQLQRVLQSHRRMEPFPESALKDFLLETASDARQAPWQAVKEEGRFYLRAYSLGHIVFLEGFLPAAVSVNLYSTAAEAAQAVAPAITDEKPPFVTQVSIPIDNILSIEDSSHSTGTQSPLTLRIDTPDDRLYEAWKDLPPAPSEENVVGSSSSVSSGSFR